MSKIISMLENPSDVNFDEIPLLCLLDKEEQDRMQGEILIKEYKRGQIVFHMGDEAKKMYIVYSGNMKVSMYLPDGREQLLYLYNPGDFVGGLNVLTGDRYVYEGVALKDSVIITLEKDDFHKVLMNNLDFIKAVLQKSYERIRTAEALIQRLSVMEADKKVATGLLNLIPIYGKELNTGILLELRINREELGSFAGISRETMSRKLRAFEQQGLLELLPKGHVLITDLEGLQHATL